MNTRKEAKKAVRHWFAQRISAVLLLVLSPILIYKFFFHMNEDYNKVLLQFSGWIDFVIVLSAIALALWHALMGMQVIFADYIHSPRVSKVLLAIFHTLYVVLLLIAVIPLLSIQLSP